VVAAIKAYARPQHLYRYRSLGPVAGKKFNQELDAISSGYVYCSSYDAMNDPMEGSHRESALLKQSKLYNRSIQAVKSSLNSLGIASFSETKDHEPMWAYYAGNFEGICIEYNVRRLLNKLPDDHEFVRMTYNEQAPMLYRDSESTENRAKLILSCKSVKWAGEREWRLIRPTVGPAKYLALNAVTAVYLGSRIRPQHEAEIVAVCESAKIRANKMKVDTYALEFTSLKSKKLIEKQIGTTLSENSIF
jgi:hypothetical protein